MLSKNVHRIAVKKRGDLSECFYYSLCSLNFFIEELALKSEKVSHRSNRRKVLTSVKIHKLQRFHYANVPGDLRKKITKWKVEFLKVKLICPYPLYISALHFPWMMNIFLDPFIKLLMTNTSLCPSIKR